MNRMRTVMARLLLRPKLLGTRIRAVALLALLLSLPLAAFASVSLQPLTFMRAPDWVSQNANNQSIASVHAPTFAGLTHAITRVGQGHIERAEHVTTIIQRSHTLVLSARSFNLGVHDRLVINQPDASALLVIRIDDVHGSVIRGHLRANGQVQLINTHGITFGKRANVIAGGLVASTVDPDATLASGMSDALDNQPAAIINLGALSVTGGGSIALSGQQVANHGQINASRSDADGGEVRLVSHGGNTINSGNINVSGAHGGKIQLLSDQDVLVASGMLTASGKLGGGEVLIGGDTHGDNPLVRNAQRTYLGRHARINVDATETGDGGKIVIWSDHHTRADGMATARASLAGGDGGFVEISSKKALAFAGNVNTSAPQGNIGILLLDPDEITITHGALGGTDGTIVCTDGDCQTPGSGPFSDSGSGALTDGTLNAQLALNDVTVTTSTDGITSNSDVVVNLQGQTLSLDSATYINLGGTFNGAGSLKLEFTTTLDLASNAPAFNANPTVTATGGGTATIEASGQTWNLTGANQGSLSGLDVDFSAVPNLADHSAGNFVFADGTSVSGSINGGGAGTLDYSAMTTGISVGLAGFSAGTATGTGGFSGVSTIKGSGGSDTIGGVGQTYALANVTPDAGDSNGVGWTAIENISDSTGTIGFGTGGSVTGNVTALTLDYSSYLHDVMMDVDTGVISVDGVGGTLSGYSTVNANAARTNTITSAGETYTLDNTVANKASSNGYNWSGFQNISDATGMVNFGTGGSVTGNVNAKILDYGAYAAAVSFDLSGGSATTTGIGGTWTGVTTVTGNGSNSAITGSTAFNLSGTNAGSTGGVTFTGFTAADAMTISGAAGFDDVSKIGEGMTFVNTTSVSGSGSITNVTGSFADNTGTSAASGIVYSGFAAVSGTGGTITNVTGSFADDTGTSAASGMVYSGFAAVSGTGGSITNVTGSFADDTGTSAASGMVYSGFDAVSGTGGTVTGVTGSFDLGTLLSAATDIDYSGFNLNTLSGVGASATITGSSQSYHLTGPNDGNSGSMSWTSFANLSDSAAGNVVFANGAASVSGNLNGGGNGTLDYTAYGAAVVNLSGAGSSGVGGTTTGIAIVETSGSLGISGTAGGSLTATSNNGAITQSAALVVTGAAVLDAGMGPIMLSNTSNDFMGAVSVTGTGIALTDKNMLNITSLTNNTNGSVALIAATALSLPAGPMDAGTGDITLTANGGPLTTVALSAHNIALTGASGITLADNMSASGNLTLTSTNAAILQTAGSVTVASSTAVNAGAAAISLNGAGNNFQGELSLLGNSASIASSGSLHTAVVNVSGNLVLSAPSVTNAAGNSTTFGNGSTTGQIAGAYVQGGNLNLHGTATTSDQLVVSGNATLGGHLALAFNAVPSAGQSFTLLNAGAVSGTFASVNATGLPAGLGTMVVYNPTSVVLTVQGSAQTLSISAPTSVILGSGPVTVTATASSGLAVTLTSNTPTLCSVSSATSPFQVVLLGIGTCSLTAAQAGDATHAAVSQPVAFAITVPAYVSVPTLNVWMLLLLALLLGAGVVVRTRRHD